MSKFFKALERAERERALASPPSRVGGDKGAAISERGRDDDGGTRPVEGPGAGPPRREEPSSLGSPASPREVAEPGMGGTDSRVGMDDHLVSLLSPTSFAAEQYRHLRHMIEQLRRAAGLSIIAVSSPEDRDGKTTTAINLAGALAQASEVRVLLIDADVRRPSVTRYLGLRGVRRGMIDAILTPGLGVEALAIPLPPLNLSVIPGAAASTPYEILKSARLGELIGEARGLYDYVVLDTPPLVYLPDCRLIEQWVDGFVVVVAADKTSRKMVEEALRVPDPDKLVGIVFNQDHDAGQGYYAYYAENGRARSTGHSSWLHGISRWGGGRKR